MDINIEAATSELSSRICDLDTQEEYYNMMVIDPLNINECCIDQPKVMMDAVMAYETANAEADKIKDVLARAYAFLDPQARQLILAAGDKISEAKVESVILNHDEYIAIQAKYHAAKANAGKWKAIMEGARHRKDMLVQIAMNFRSEGNSEISVRSLDLEQKMRAAREVVG